MQHIRKIPRRRTLHEVGVRHRMEKAIFHKVALRFLFAEEHRVGGAVRREKAVRQILVGKKIIRENECGIIEIGQNRIKSKPRPTGLPQHPRNFRAGIHPPVRLAADMPIIFNPVEIPPRVEIPIPAKIAKPEAVVHAKEKLSVETQKASPYFECFCRMRMQFQSGDVVKVYVTKACDLSGSDKKVHIYIGTTSAGTEIGTSAAVATTGDNSITDRKSVV